MREWNQFVWHCSATREGQHFDVNDIRKMHKKRGFRDVGYHFLVLLDGTIQIGRPLDQSGAHVKGHNSDTIGGCYIGGLDKNGKPKDTRTPEQIRSMDMISKFFEIVYGLECVGHRDLSPDLDGDGVVERHEWLKECPCFDVQAWRENVKLSDQSSIVYKTYEAFQNITPLIELLDAKIEPCDVSDINAAEYNSYELGEEFQIPSVFGIEEIDAAMMLMKFRQVQRGNLLDGLEIKWIVKVKG